MARHPQELGHRFQPFLSVCMGSIRKRNTLILGVAIFRSSRATTPTTASSSPASSSFRRWARPSGSEVDGLIEPSPDPAPLRSVLVRELCRQLRLVPVAAPAQAFEAA